MAHHVSDFRRVALNAVASSGAQLVSRLPAGGHTESKCFAFFLHRGFVSPGPHSGCVKNEARWNAVALQESDLLFRQVRHIDPQLK